ncbi:MAG: hypothetical protein KAR20_02985, partial [Candidatus Heimdallarchaeota archaeon]|nr:hypothetical protein [Candidatus Heimdallarchaeota archaeon]
SNNDDGVSAAGGKTDKPEVQTDLLDDALSFGGAVVDSATSGSLKPIVDRYAPGLWDLVNGGLVETFREKIFKGISGIFKRVQKALEGGSLAKKIKELFSGSTEKLKSWKESVSDACGSFYEKIQSLVDFLGELMDPVIQEIREELKGFADFVGEVWTDFGKPAWEAIKQFAGEAWDWIKEKAEWIWDVTAPIRELVADVWDWIKTQLGIMADSTSSVWNSIKEMAAEIWNEIKAYIRPILGPLKKIGAILLLLSPMGPILAIYKSAPYIWKALKWIYNNWSGWETLIKLKEYFANEILPVIQDGIQQLKGLLSSVTTWIKGIVKEIKIAVRQFLKSIGVFEAIEAVRSFIGEVRSIFNDLKTKFNQFIDSVKEEISPVFNAAKQLLSVLWQCIRPVLTFIIGLVYLVFNPAMWPVYAVALIARLAWMILPDNLKLAAIDYLINLARRAIEYFRPTGMPEAVWSVFEAGANSFFDKINSYTPDIKIRFVEKILNFLIDPQTYGGLVFGLVAGFVQQAVDLVVGVVSLIFSLPGIITGIVNFLRRLIPDLEF